MSTAKLTSEALIQRFASCSLEALRGSMFRIKLDNDHEIFGYTAGRMRRYRIRVLPGDRVRVELSPYDLGRGRIVFRFQ